MSRTLDVEDTNIVDVRDGVEESGTLSHLSSDVSKRTPRSNPPSKRGRGASSRRGKRGKRHGKHPGTRVRYLEDVDMTLDNAGIPLHHPPSSHSSHSGDSLKRRRISPGVSRNSHTSDSSKFSASLSSSMGVESLSSDSLLDARSDNLVDILTAKFDEPSLLADRHSSSNSGTASLRDVPAVGRVKSRRPSIGGAGRPFGPAVGIAGGFTGRGILAQNRARVGPKRRGITQPISDFASLLFYREYWSILYNDDGERRQEIQKLFPTHTILGQAQNSGSIVNANNIGIGVAGNSITATNSSSLLGALPTSVGGGGSSGMFYHPLVPNGSFRSLSSSGLDISSADLGISSSSGSTFQSARHSSLETSGSILSGKVSTETVGFPMSLKHPEQQISIPSMNAPGSMISPLNGSSSTLHESGISNTLDPGMHDALYLHYLRKKLLQSDIDEWNNMANEYSAQDWSEDGLRLLDLVRVVCGSLWAVYFEKFRPRSRRTEIEMETMVREAFPQYAMHLSSVDRLATSATALSQVFESIMKKSRWVEVRVRWRALSDVEYRRLRRFELLAVRGRTDDINAGILTLSRIEDDLAIAAETKIQARIRYRDKANSRLRESGPSSLRIEFHSDDVSEEPSLTVFDVSSPSHLNHHISRVTPDSKAPAKAESVHMNHRSRSNRGKIPSALPDRPRSENIEDSSPRPVRPPTLPSMTDRYLNSSSSALSSLISPSATETVHPAPNFTRSLVDFEKIPHSPLEVVGIHDPIYWNVTAKRIKIFSESVRFGDLISVLRGDGVEFDDSSLLTIRLPDGSPCVDSVWDENLALDMQYFDIRKPFTDDILPYASSFRKSFGDEALAKLPFRHVASSPVELDPISVQIPVLLFHVDVIR